MVRRRHPFTGIQRVQYHKTVLLGISVRLFAWKNYISTGQTFTTFHISVSFQNLPRKFKVNWSLKILTGTSDEYLSTFVITSHWILRRMRNVSDKKCIENLNTHFMFNNFFPTNRAVYNTQMCFRARQAKGDNTAQKTCKNTDIH
jgi:hypothetical protein